MIHAEIYNMFIVYVGPWVIPASGWFLPAVAGNMQS